MGVHLLLLYLKGVYGRGDKNGLPEILDNEYNLGKISLFQLSKVTTNFRDMRSVYPRTGFCFRLYS